MRIYELYAKWLEDENYVPSNAMLERILIVGLQVGSTHLVLKALTLSSKEHRSKLVKLVKEDSSLMFFLLQCKNPDIFGLTALSGKRAIEELVESAPLDWLLELLDKKRKFTSSVPSEYALEFFKACWAKNDESIRIAVLKSITPEFSGIPKDWGAWLQFTYSSTFENDFNRNFWLAATDKFDTAWLWSTFEDEHCNAALPASFIFLSLPATFITESVAEKLLHIQLQYLQENDNVACVSYLTNAYMQAISHLSEKSYTRESVSFTVGKMLQSKLYENSAYAKALRSILKFSDYSDDCLEKQIILKAVNYGDFSSELKEAFASPSFRFHHATTWTMLANSTSLSVELAEEALLSASVIERESVFLEVVKNKTENWIQQLLTIISEDLDYTLVASFFHIVKNHVSKPALLRFAETLWKNAPTLDTMQSLKQKDLLYTEIVLGFNIKILEQCPNSVVNILQAETNSALGEDSTKWEIFAKLLNEFEGTYQELLTLVTLVTD